MSEARSVRCGECGGPNPAGVRSCGFCRAAIATLRCSSCYQLNFPEHDFCAGCGHQLGLEPTKLPLELHCPDCRVTCQALDGDPGVLYDCPNCGGQFVEHTLLRLLLERRRRYVHPVVPGSRRPTTLDVVRYLPCPVCAQMMNRYNFGKNSGVIVDVCSAHGIWFDHGELARVLTFVDQCGLPDARGLDLGLPRPRTPEEQRATAAIVARALSERQERTQRIRERSPATLVVEGVLEVGLDTLELIGKWILYR